MQLKDVAEEALKAAIPDQVEDLIAAGLAKLRKEDEMQQEVREEAAKEGGSVIIGRATLELLMAQIQTQRQLAGMSGALNGLAQELAQYEGFLRSFQQLNGAFEKRILALESKLGIGPSNGNTAKPKG